MTDLTIAIAAIVGATAGGTMGLLISWAAGMYGRRPYSSAAIAFRATAEDAAKVRSNPMPQRSCD